MTIRLLPKEEFSFQLISNIQPSTQLEVESCSMRTMYDRAIYVPVRRCAFLGTLPGMNGDDNKGKV